MSCTETEKLRGMLGRHPGAFQKTEEPLGKTNLVQHKIDLARPVKQRARKLPLQTREEASKQMAQKKRDGLIEPSTSP